MWTSPLGAGRRADSCWGPCSRASGATAQGLCLGFPGVEAPLLQGLRLRDAGLGRVVRGPLTRPRPGPRQGREEGPGPVAAWSFANTDKSPGGSDHILCARDCHGLPARSGHRSPGDGGASRFESELRPRASACTPAVWPGAGPEPLCAFVTSFVSWGKNAAPRWVREGTKHAGGTVVLGPQQPPRVSASVTTTTTPSPRFLIHDGQPEAVRAQTSLRGAHGGRALASCPDRPTPAPFSL